MTSSRRSEIHEWVVGIDGSDNSIVSLRWAIARAAASCEHGVEVRLRVVAAWNAAVLSAVKPDEMTAAVGSRAESILHSLDHHGVDIDVTVTRRGAAEALLDVSTGAELLVVGRRGLSGLKELVLGSVSRQCATHAVVPTVVVPDHAPLGAIDKVVVGYDGSGNSERALSWVFDTVDRIAESPQLVVVNALEIATHGGSDLVQSRFPDIAEESERDFRESMRRIDPSGRLTPQFAVSGVRRALVDAAHDAQLLVLGARGHGAIGAALLGSASAWMLHHTPCALAIVPGD